MNNKTKMWNSVIYSALMYVHRKLAYREESWRMVPGAGIKKNKEQTFYGNYAEIFWYTQ